MDINPFKSKHEHNMEKVEDGLMHHMEVTESGVVITKSMAYHGECSDCGVVSTTSGRTPHKEMVIPYEQLGEWEEVDER